LKTAELAELLSAASRIQKARLELEESRDGSDPMAGLIAVGGVLYGTTTTDGSRNHGTIFKVAMSGAESVIQRFGDPDGNGPCADLIALNGALYGTTKWGGAYDLGTVFRVKTTGKEVVLHSFGHGSDGSWLYGGLVVMNGTLYGTTAYDGDDHANGGSVFALTP
jgi:uncharacterized repeat protein (TIGR03803 family)